MIDIPLKLRNIEVARIHLEQKGIGPEDIHGNRRTEEAKGFQGVESVLDGIEVFVIVSLQERMSWGISQNFHRTFMEVGIYREDVKGNENELNLEDISFSLRNTCMWKKIVPKLNCSDLRRLLAGIIKSTEEIYNYFHIIVNFNWYNIFRWNLYFFNNCKHEVNINKTVQVLIYILGNEYIKPNQKLILVSTSILSWAVWLLLV